MYKLLGLLLFTAVLILSAQTTFSQGSAGNGAVYESRYAVDMPTAGVIPKGDYSVGMQFFSSGGLAVNVDYGFFKNFNAGVSLSGVNIIGYGDVKLQNVPGINVKYRFIDETLAIPAFAVGLNTQGKGEYQNSSNRFEFFSPGIFLAVSKNFTWDLGDLAMHGGINYSFENPTDNFLMNYYFGIEQSLLSRLSVSLEYNSSVFEREAKRIDSPGLVNSSLRCSIGEGFTLELQLRDLLETINKNNSIVRFVGIEYINRL